MLVFLNGRLVPEAEAVVPISDRGLLYGDGLFETLRLRRGQPLWWERHWERLRRGADFLRIPLPAEANELRAAAQELARANDLTDGVLRVLLTRGSGPRGYSPGAVGRPTLALTLHPLPASRADVSLSLATASQRVLSTEALNAFKTSNRLPAVLARAEAERAGADEALLLNSREEVVEAGSGNLFWFSGTALSTTPLSSGALPGVIRGLLIDRCRDAGHSVIEQAITLPELTRVQGLFLTNSIVGLVRVRSVDGQAVAPDKGFAELQARFAQWEDGEASSSAVTR